MMRVQIGSEGGIAVKPEEVTRHSHVPPQHLRQEQCRLISIQS